MRQLPGLFGIIMLTASIITIPLLASAQEYQRIISTDVGTLKAGIIIEPASPKAGESSKLKIYFLNPQINSIQEHVDYTITITNGGAIFGPIPLTHTSIGTVTIPVQFRDGHNQVVIDVQGILFRPIPSEKAAFSVTIGDKQDSVKTSEKKSDSGSKDDKNKQSKDSKDKQDKKKVKKDTKKKDAKKKIKIKTKLEKS